MRKRHTGIRWVIERLSPLSDLGGTIWINMDQYGSIWAPELKTQKTWEKLTHTNQDILAEVSR